MKILGKLPTKDTEETKSIKEESDLIKRELILDILELTERDMRNLKYRTQKLLGAIELRLMEYNNVHKKLEGLKKDISHRIREKENNK